MLQGAGQLPRPVALKQVSAFTTLQVRPHPFLSLRRMQRIPPDAVAVAAQNAAPPSQMLWLSLRKILLLCGFP